MSEKDINRWSETVHPRSLKPYPWEIGSGGSWDMAKIQPITDEMLSELTQRFAYAGTPWNCRSMPLSDGDREYMYLLYFSMQGLVARMRKAEEALAACEIERDNLRGTNDYIRAQLAPHVSDFLDGRPLENIARHYIDSPHYRVNKFAATARVSLGPGDGTIADLYGIRLTIQDLETVVRKSAPPRSAFDFATWWAERGSASSAERSFAQSVWDAATKALVEKLRDPVAVHVNMLRGIIAPITMLQCAHVIGNGEVERYTALTNPKLSEARVDGSHSENAPGSERAGLITHNAYICAKCEGRIITEDRDEGTTPFLIGCKVTKGCDGTMRSLLYRGVQAHEPVTFIWRKPTRAEYVAAPAAMKEHFDNGGLDLYPNA